MRRMLIVAASLSLLVAVVATRSLASQEPNRVQGVYQSAPAGTASATVSQEVNSFYAPDALNVDTQVRHSDIVLVGKVVRVDPARWNSPDGKSWTPTDPLVAPLLFRTFYVEPTEVLKGTSAYGTPVPFMVLGGTEGERGGPVNVGDVVLVFGRDRSTDTAKDGHWPKGYRANVDEFSIYAQDGDVFANEVGQADPKVGKTTLDQVRGLVTATE